jgi:20S proteasome alpha/beta subunit
MTIVVGLPCNGGVVLGADSEEGTGIDKTSVQKVANLGGENYRCLIAGAGDGDFIDLAVQRIRSRLSSGLSQADMHTAMQDVVTDIHENQIDRYPEGERLDRGFDLLAATWVKGETAKLVKVSRALSVIQDKPSTIGVGGYLARYILSTLAFPSPGIAAALRLAVYLLDQVKKHAAHCGGSSQVVYLADTGISEELAPLTLFQQEFNASSVMGMGAKWLFYLTDPWTFQWNQELAATTGVDNAAARIKESLRFLYQPPPPSPPISETDASASSSAPGLPPLSPPAAAPSSS